MATWTARRPVKITIDGAVRRLDVALIRGKLNVIGAKGPARVEVAAVGRKPLVVRHEGNTLTISHAEQLRLPAFLWRLNPLAYLLRVNVSIVVPAEAFAALRVAAGSIVASGLHGGADVEVRGGRIALLGISGRVTAKAVDGAIEAVGIGGDLTVRTVDGEITLADLTADRVYARTVDGAILCDLGQPTSHVGLETVDGKITVRIRDDSDMDVELRTVGGRVDADFDELRPAQPPASRHSLAGTLGTGLGQLRASTVDGNITLLRQPVAGFDPPGFGSPGLDPPSFGSPSFGSPGFDPPSGEDPT
jgi:Putative adhesin